jgi:membrane protease YdiL (CAAX protease family)
MDEKEQFPKPMEAFFVIFLSFIVVFGITIMLIAMSMPNTEDLPQTSTLRKFLITSGTVGLIVLPVLYIRRKKLSLRQVFRWKAIPLPIIFWSIIIGVSMTILGDEVDRLINLLLPAPEFLEEMAQAMKIQSLSDFLIMFGGMVIAAGVIEESLFRGFLQNSLEKYLDVTRAVIYASLAWTFYHFIIYWAIQIFLLGIVLGLLAWKSNSVFPAIIGHGLNNAAALFYYNIDTEKLAGTYLWGDHVSPLFLLLATTGLVYGFKVFYRHYSDPPRMPFSET